MERVQVLMSTYNGEKFLHQQIESILRQDGVDVMLTVRDDGSTDETCAILDEYQAQGLLRWYSGENLGPARSFLQLLQDADAADFYAFADQDDYWQPDKLSAAVGLIEQNGERPALYFSPTQPTDSDLQPLPATSLTPLLTFGEALVCEFVSGCTMLINFALRSLVNTYTPQYLSMHDVWIYSVAQAVGAGITFDPAPHILYRQHSNNTVGTDVSSMKRWQKRWHRFAGNEQSRSRRAQEIKQGFYDKMPDENCAILDAFLRGKHSLPARWRLAIDKRFECGDRQTQRLFKLNILTNKY